MREKRAEWSPPTLTIIAHGHTEGLSAACANTANVTAEGAGTAADKIVSGREDTTVSFFGPGQPGPS